MVAGAMVLPLLFGWNSIRGKPWAVWGGLVLSLLVLFQGPLLRDLYWFGRYRDPGQNPGLDYLAKVENRWHPRDREEPWRSLAVVEPTLPILAFALALLAYYSSRERSRVSPSASAEGGETGGLNHR